MADDTGQAVNKVETQRVEFGGSVYEGTPEDIIQKMGQSIAHANATIKSRGDEIEHLREDLRTREESLATNAAPPKEGEFDPRKYYTDWQQDPRIAELNALAAAIGADAEELKETFRETIARRREAREVENTLADFYQRVGTEYQASPEAAELLLERSNRNVGRARRINSNDLISAFDQLRQEGKFKAEKAPEDNSKRKIPPSVANLGEGGERSAPDLENMTAEQLKGLARKMGMKA